MVLSLSYAHIAMSRSPHALRTGKVEVHGSMGRWLLVLITLNRLMQGIVDLDIYRKLFPQVETVSISPQFTY